MMMETLCFEGARRRKAVTRKGKKVRRRNCYQRKESRKIENEEDAQRHLIIN